MKGKLAFVLSMKREFLSNTFLNCTNISGQNEPDLSFIFVEIQVLKNVQGDFVESRV